jgi:hypothetical protein
LLDLRIFKSGAPGVDIRENGQSGDSLRHCGKGPRPSVRAGCSKRTSRGCSNALAAIGKRWKLRRIRVIEVEGDEKHDNLGTDPNVKSPGTKSATSTNGVSTSDGGPSRRRTTALATSRQPRLIRLRPCGPPRKRARGAPGWPSLTDQSHFLTDKPSEAAKRARCDMLEEQSAGVCCGVDVEVPQEVLRGAE